VVLLILSDVTLWKHTTRSHLRSVSGIFDAGQRRSMDGEISGEELAEAIEDGEDEPVIVDIREPRAFEREHIPGSVNVPFSRLPQEVDRVGDADHVVTVCPHGKASVQAARLITSYEGFDGRVESLAPGIEGWAGPVESDVGTAASADGGTDDGPDAPF
jgi:rhodanese-related sulfurtransferase